MNKEDFKTIIELYKESEDIVMKLNNEFGICMFYSNKSNFYNNYNLIIRKLFDSLFGQEKANLIENYIFDETKLTFDELYNIITNEREA